MKMRIVGLLFTLLGSGCAAEAGAIDQDSSPAQLVTQGGPQDIAEFRKVVDNRSVPAPELLDEVGFFAEHAVDLPAPSCDQPLCFHPMLAVAPRFDGGNWTMAFVAANTAVKATEAAEATGKARHLVLLIEHSSRTYATLPELAPLAEALMAELEPEDRVSLGVIGTQVEWLVEAQPAPALNSLELPGEASARELAADGIDPKVNPHLVFANERGSDLYASLVSAYALTQADALTNFNQRLLLFTSGVVDRGVQSQQRFHELGARFAQAQTAISSFGMGNNYQRDIPRTLAEIGSGNYYFAGDSEDLLQAAQVEAKTRFVPLARDLKLELTAAPGYQIGRIYGARNAVVSGNQATLSSPVLFMGARTSSADVATGRRGGGGGWFVELRADAAPGVNPPEPADVFSLNVSYKDGRSGQRIQQQETLRTPLGTGNNPMPDAPFFSKIEYAKPFMMLNMYLALRTALTRYQAGSCGQAQGVQQMMAQSYNFWKLEYDDPDIDADFALLKQLTAVIEQRCQAEVARPVGVPYSCFWF